MKKIILTYLTFFLLIRPVFASSIKDIKVNNLLRVMMTEDICNFMIKDEKILKGFFYVLAEEYAKHLEVKLEVKKILWDELFYHKGKIPENLGIDNKIKYNPDHFADNKTDIIAGNITRLKWRENLFKVIPIEQNIQIIISLFSKKISDINGIKNQRVGIIKNTTYETTAKKKLGKIDFIPDYSCFDDKDLFVKLANNEIDYAIVDSISYISYIKTFKNIEICFRISDKTEDIGWAFDNNNTELNEDFSKFIKYYKQTGKYAQLWEKHFGLKYYQYKQIFR